MGTRAYTTPHTPPSSPQPPPVICVRHDMEGVDCKKVLKNINGNVLANEDFFLDLMKRNEIRLSCPGLF